jgi:hypothetical protein
VLPGAPDPAQHARILAMFTMTGMTGQIRPSQTILSNIKTLFIYIYFKLS